MNEEALYAAIREAERFLKKAKDCKCAMSDSALLCIVGGKATSSVRRSSMDLTRALADLRRGGRE